MCTSRNANADLGGGRRKMSDAIGPRNKRKRNSSSVSSVPSISGFPQTNGRTPHPRGLQSNTAPVQHGSPLFFCFLLSSHQCRRPIDAVSLVRLLSTVGYYGRALHTQQHPVAASTILLLLLLRGDLNANSTATVTGVSAETLSAWWSILTAKNRWDMCFFVFVF